MKKIRLRKWVKVTLLILTILLLIAIVYQLFTKKTIYTTPAGSYECNGGIVQVCHGSEEVVEYLGV